MRYPSASASSPGPAAGPAGDGHQHRPREAAAGLPAGLTMPALARRWGDLTAQDTYAQGLRALVDGDLPGPTPG